MKTSIPNNFFFPPVHSFIGEIQIIMQDKSMSLTLAPKINTFISTGDFFFVDVNVRKGFDNKIDHENESSTLLRYTSRLVQYLPSSHRLSYPILNENFEIDIPSLLFQLYLPIDRKINVFPSLVLQMINI